MLNVRVACVILFGLLPIMWSPAMQVGADVMKRIATPMIGGIVTSGILELLIYPVIYVIWRKRELSDQTEKEAPLIPPALIPAKLKVKR
jgi:Cu/Ag efflux pump CusA